jgi:hypothetical protein
MAGRRMGTHPIHQARQAPTVVVRHWPRQELRLSAFAVWRHHQALRDEVADTGAVVAPHQVQQHVQAGSRAGRGDDLAGIDIQVIFQYLDARITARQLFRIAPVGGGAQAIEHSGGGEHEHPGTDRAQARAALVGRTDQCQQRRRWFLVCVAPARDDDGVGARNQLRRVRRRQRDAARRPDRSGFDRADGKVIPLHA